MIMLCVSLRNLLVRDAFKVVPLELAMPSNFWFVFYGWSYLSVSRLVVFHLIQSPIERQNLVINKCV